jgi:hypothetical protein
MHKPIYTDRETARVKLAAKLSAPDPIFSTYPEDLIREDAAWRLRWLDCAPDGANHCLAPLQDKRGVPMGGVYNENIGPNQALRAARLRLGRNPFGGNGAVAA